jgi:hypothetical protein
MNVLVLACMEAGCAAGAGSGVAQASFEPHASILLRVEKLVRLVLCACAGAGCAGLGCERLKAEKLGCLCCGCC